MTETATTACHHQWSIWKNQRQSATQTRWCHICNSTEERPRARYYQEFDVSTLPNHIARLPACTTQECLARAGEPCTDRNGEPVYVWHHGNRVPPARQEQP